MEETALTVQDENTQIEQIHNVVEKLTPVKEIETALAKFLQDTFIMAKEEDDFQKQIKLEVIKRLPDLKSNELIAMLTSATTNKNDMFSKLISPVAQLLSSAQQAELASRQSKDSPQFQQTNIRQINSVSPSEVLQGLQSLFNLAEAVKKKEEITSSNI